MPIIEQFIHELNDPQRRAVEHTDGPLLILAGAGSGKTRVLTYRLANLIALGAAMPSQILAVTFTNKAAKNMEIRAHQLLQRMGIPMVDRMWISTFHSSCVRILRSHIERLKYQPFFAIYDSDDQLSVIKKIATSLNLNEKVYPPKTFQGLINQAKQLGQTPDKFALKASNLFEEKCVSVYKSYEEEMHRSNALDFGDLLLKTVLLFDECPDVLQSYQDQFRYLMVDEYQDTNAIQYRLVQMLSGLHQNLCVVGDEDQSIYSWRGADISNILNFEKDFPQAVTIRLEENYRSTKTIVTAASHVIENNTQRLGKKNLFTSNDMGDPIIVREEMNEYEEARYVAQSIRTILSSENITMNDVAIFYRTNAQSRVLEEQLRSLSLPYRIIGGMKFYERMEIKDILAYLKVIVNPQDALAYQRILNVPARGIGKTTLQKIQDVMLQEKVGFRAAIEKGIQLKLFNSSTSQKLISFLNLVQKIQQNAPNKKPTEIYHMLLDETKYIEYLRAQEKFEADSRIQNLEEFDNALTQFEKERGSEGTLQAFLEEIALVTEIEKTDEEQKAITMMTLHLSKGLEYPYVFIVGLEEGLFPSGRGANDGLDDEMEEERRLAYVGMTRAEKVLTLTYARSRRVWGAEQNNPPSRFLSEIPKDLVQASSSLNRPKFIQRFTDRFGASSQMDDQPAPYDSSWKEDSFDGFPDYENINKKKTGSPFKKGARVKHPVFGVGTIYQLEGDGDDQRVTILFGDQSLKKFITKYARLEPA